MDPHPELVSKLAIQLRISQKDVVHALAKAATNVRIILERQYASTAQPTSDRPLCKLIGEQAFIEELTPLPPGRVLETLARLYEKCHVKLCRNIYAKTQDRSHNTYLCANPVVDIRPLTDRAVERAFQNEIVLEVPEDKIVPLRAVWKPISIMSFDHLPVLENLSGILPGESSGGRHYAGIGCGGGSDIISASLLGLLLRHHNKTIDLLVSTRTWKTGSLGQPGSKLGVTREVLNHGGHAIDSFGRPVPGTFRIRQETTTEGRDLERIPLTDCHELFLVLDQGDSINDIPEADRVDLVGQFRAVLAQTPQTIDTIFVVDTGGDVFGAGSTDDTTPEQDRRVQQALSHLSSSSDLVTVVFCPGVDAPPDAPEKALRAGGMVYRPTNDEKRMLLDVLVHKYRMDGSIPGRYGKTNLALQARLSGIEGAWHCLSLPLNVSSTWENPWETFVYIQRCMDDIIIVPSLMLLDALSADDNHHFQQIV